MSKTNARSFLPDLRAHRPPELVVLAASYLRRFRRHVLRREVDDFDWTTYHQFYGPQNEIEGRYYTYDLGEVDHLVHDGRLYTVSDAKPIHPRHRALFEAVLGLPGVGSIHEIGTGGGKLIVNMGTLLGPAVTLGASDLGAGQLALFARNWPEHYRRVAPFPHDITAAPLPERAQADVVFTATVLMHIKRDAPYRAALRNLLRSARSHLVLAEHWDARDYATDLRDAAREVWEGSELSLRSYDSGAEVVLVASRGDEPLPERYAAVSPGSRLTGYR